MSRRSLFWPALGAAFALLVALHVHGFSLAAWHSVIDGSPASEVWLGEPRLIRTDDWNVQLPLAFSQAAQTPAFPAVNRLVGLGQSAWLPIELPVAHPLTLFRPTMWGFFLGDDVGMAWMWWTRVFGLFAIWLVLFRVVSGGRAAIALAGAVALLGAPFFAFWSFNAAPHAASLGAGVLAGVGCLRARRPAAIVACGLALAAAGAWFALAIYPPFQVTLAWLGVALLAGLALEARAGEGSPGPGGHLALRIAVAAAAVLLVAVVVGAFLREARPAIEAMTQTAYPGLRLATGGDRTLWQLANAPLAAGLWAEGWGPLHNICEAASFWWLAPPLAALCLWRWLRGQALDPVIGALLVYQWLLLVYVTLGFPEPLARLTGLSLAPGRRAVIGLGLADLLLVVRFLARAAPAEPGERRFALVLAVVWALALGAAALPLSKALPGARLAWLLPLAAANGGLAWLALTARRRALPLALLAAASLATTAWFNPVAVGGSRWLRENELSRRILAIDREAGGGTVWAAFGRDDIADLFRVLGLRSVNGILPNPQPELWERVDPRGSARGVWNRYAHFLFTGAANGGARFRLYSQDYVIVAIDPRSPALAALGVTHLLFRGNERQRRLFERLSGFERLASVGENHLYRVPPPPASAP